MRQSYIRPLRTIGAADVPLTGGKAASLGALLRASIPVPDGFVVCVTAFDDFLAASGRKSDIAAILTSIDTHAAADEASTEIRCLLDSVEIPTRIVDAVSSHLSCHEAPAFAVRSSAPCEDSAAASWAGLFHTDLNVAPAGILTSIKRCWMSLFSAGALRYRLRIAKLNFPLAMAVIVQEMVEADVSGVAFSSHPITFEDGCVLIEAAYGLGDAVVSGRIRPHCYTIAHPPPAVVNESHPVQLKGSFLAQNGGLEDRPLPDAIASVSPLSTDELYRLTSLVLETRRVLSTAVDVEWAMAANRVFVLQARPITHSAKELSVLPPPPNCQSPEVDLREYRRLFHLDGFVPFAISDHFVRGYMDVGALVAADEQSWTAYIPSRVIPRTHADGLRLHLAPHGYSAYVAQFESLFDRIDSLYRQLRQSTCITRDECSLFMGLLKSYRELYRTTEHFYTDGIHDQSQRGTSDAALLKSFGQMKLKGRELLERLYMSSDAYFPAILETLAVQFNISATRVLAYSLPEVIALFDDERPSEQILEERSERYIIRWHAGEILTYTGRVAKDILAAQPIAVSDPKQVLGQTAVPGRVRATARVVRLAIGADTNLRASLDDMPGGHVLVVDTTGPSLIVACTKASAIVTNQGGMFSHAAIVAKELGIPCIVGTLTATEAIQDGDYIEVNANEGRVTILVPARSCK